jgi:uncharacterized protein with HEPN domain
LHIQEAIAYIEKFVQNKSKEDIYDDALMRFAVERQLEIIGEASNNLTSSIKERFPEIEWKRVIGFRNFLAHEYFGVDLELVWDIVETKIPPLKTVIEKMLI